jgi:hypothetical protein
MAKSKLRQLVRLPWAADSCPWVGKLRTVLPLMNRDVIRDSAVQLGWTHQRGAIGVLVEGVWSALGGGVVDDLVPSQPPMFQQALQDGFVPLAEHLAHVHHEPAAAQKWRIVMLGLDTAKQRIVMLGLDTARQRMAPARGTIVSRKIGGRGVTAS